MVNEMVSRAKKADLNLRLIAAYHTGVSLGDKCHGILSIIKQMWFVPFFWSLTWFSYWIIRDIFVLNTSLTQIKPLNLAGAVFSISVLLLATPRLGTSIRKKAIRLRTHLGIDIKKDVIHTHIRPDNYNRSTSFHSAENIAPTTQVEKIPLEKPQRKYQSPFRKNEISEPKNVSEKTTKSQSIANALSSSSSYSRQNQISQEISAECLTCANLVSCKYRRYNRDESPLQNHKISKCPLMEKLSSNRSAAA
jgi:hypothetical protein